MICCRIFTLMCALAGLWAESPNPGCSACIQGCVSTAKLYQLLFQIPAGLKQPQVPLVREFFPLQVIPRVRISGFSQTPKFWDIFSARLCPVLGAAGSFLIQTDPSKDEKKIFHLVMDKLCLQDLCLAQLCVAIKQKLSEFAVKCLKVSLPINDTSVFGFSWRKERIK